MNRSHLIARRFGGLSIRENSVPLWEYANQRLMRPVEDRVAALLNTGQRVYYVAAPVYSPADPYVPLGIQLYILSSGGADLSRFLPNQQFP